MNREEAIKIFQNKLHTMEHGAICCNFGIDKDAFTLAIQALEQEPFDDIILSLTNRVVTQVTEDMDNFIFTTIKPWCEAKEQREISKRDLEQALTQYFSKEPCEDAISRQAVINIIDSWLSCNDYNKAERHIMRAMQSELYDLPSVNLHPKTGHWIYGKYRDTCSECRHTYPKKMGLMDYCPACGVKMTESEVQE